MAQRDRRIEPCVLSRLSGGYIKVMNQRRSFHASEAYLPELVSIGFE